MQLNSSLGQNTSENMVSLVKPLVTTTSFRYTIKTKVPNIHHIRAGRNFPWKLSINSYHCGIANSTVTNAVWKSTSHVVVCAAPSNRSHLQDVICLYITCFFSFCRPALEMGRYLKTRYDSLQTPCLSMYVSNAPSM